MNKEPRRKNNAQSASSGRAAELLAKSNGSSIFAAGNVNPFEAVSTAFDDQLPREVALNPEILVILKKLVKKDSITREKTLRELIDSSSNQSQEVQARIFQDFVYQFEKLALDGSAPVRAYSIRALSHFIKALKKQSEAYFKTVIPYVILAQSDASTSVVQQAEVLLTENFPESKREKLLNIFAPSAAKLSIEFIKKESPLFDAQKYDTEEDKNQRSSRLIAQGLNTLAKLQSISPPIKEVSELIGSLLQDAQLLKTAIKESDQIKLGLLRLSASPSSGMIEFLISSPLAKWVIENLDSKELLVSQACFSALVDMAGNSTFFKKFDVTKMIIPRLLNVIRKKDIHWNSCSPLYLPMTSLIYDALPEESRLDFLIRLLESFNDNLPFEVTSLISPWSRSFCECSKFAILKQGSNHEIIDVLSKLILQFANKVIEDKEASQQIADLIRWMVFKEYFSQEKLNSFLDVLGNNLANLSSSSDFFVRTLFSDPIPRRFCALSSSLLKSPFKLKAVLISSLQYSETEYLNELMKAVDLGSLVFSEGKDLPEELLTGFSQLTLTLLKNPNANFEMQVGSVGEKVLNDCEAEDLVLFEKHFPKDGRSQFIIELIDQLTDSKNHLALSKLFKVLPIKERCSHISDFLKRHDTSVHKNFFFAEICLQHELDATTGTLLTKSLYEKLLADRVMISDNSIKVFTRLFSMYPIPATELKSVWTNISQETSFQKIEEMARLYSQLCCSSISFDTIFPSKDEVMDFLREIERYTFPSVLAELGILSTSSYANPSKRTREEWLRIRLLLRNQSYFALRTATQELSNRKWALCISAAHLVLHQIGGIIYYTFDEDRNVDEKIASLFETALQNDLNFTDSILDGLCTFPDETPRIVLLAAKTLAKYSTKTPTFLNNLQSPQLFHLSCAFKNKSVLSELKNEEDRWILRYHTSDSLDFLKALSRTVSSGNLDFQLFIAGGSEERLTVCTLRASLDVLTRHSIADLDPSLIDFIICGLLTIFDSSDTILINKKSLSANPLVVTSVSLACRIFTIYSSISASTSDSIQKEWTELFYPTISQIIVRIFVDLVDSEYPADCPILTPLCRAIWAFDTMVDESSITVETKLNPTLDSYNYSENTQTLLTHCSNLLQSEIHHAQFAADHLLKLYAWKMYQHENGTYSGDNEEEKLDLKDSTIVRRPPIVLKEIISSSLSLSTCLALDTCLRIIPLFTSHAERVAYFDSLAPLVLRSLPVIISLASKEIKKEEASNLFLHAAPLETPNTVLHYACRLLFRLVELVPALVRMWFNNLDRAPSISVNKFFRENLSSLAIEEELRKVRNDTEGIMGGENELKVRTLPAAGEVVAEYRVEETTMRLVIVLPPEWPLRVPQISLDKAVVASERAKKWLLQLTAFLFHQNGSIIEGLAQWKRQVDREVSGADACTICMMSVHSTSHQLPKVRCRQCRNKFHSNCLYKWFESSNQSSCPLCRANFT